MKIDGKQIASEILSKLSKNVSLLKEKGIIPHLYIILLTDDESTAAYIRQKVRKGKEIGVRITVDNENQQITTEDLIRKIEILNKDSDIQGIIVQRPMPTQLDEKQIEEAITTEKDIDGFNSASKFGIPVALAVLEILQKIHTLKFETEDFETWLKTQNITVIGRGLTAGGPIIKALEKMGLKPTIVSSKTEEKEKIITNSDIVICAVGKPSIVTKSILKQDVILIGVGMHKEEDGKFHGDYIEEDIETIASFYTPTPGGVGPVNVAMLLKNLVKASIA